MILTEMEWENILELILKINTISELDDMRMEVMSFLKYLIPYDGITFFLADASRYMHSPLAIGIEPDHIAKYSSDWEEIDPKKWIFISNQSRAFRESDLLPEEVRQSHPYYNVAYKVLDISHSAILSMAYDSEFVGVLSLYRYTEHEDFSEKDLFILEKIKDHLAYRLYRESHRPRSCSDSDIWKLPAFIARHQLSRQEAHILPLILEGASNEEICGQLFISPSTLKKHNSNIYKKAGVKNKGELLQLILKERNLS